MKTSEIVRHELISLNVQVVKSKNKNLVGLKGKIVDETRNMFVIKTKDGTKKLVKDQSSFVFSFKGKKIEVEGKILVGRPEQRIKKAHVKKRVSK